MPRDPENPPLDDVKDFAESLANLHEDYRPTPGKRVPYQIKIIGSRDYYHSAPGFAYGKFSQGGRGTECGDSGNGDHIESGKLFTQ